MHIHTYVCTWMVEWVIAYTYLVVAVPFPLVSPLAADFITFLAMCFKTFRIFRGAGLALNLTLGDDWDGTLKGYWTAR